MTLDLSFILSLLALGVLVGFVAGLLGVGGGGIMVPMLTTIFLWQGLPAAKAVHLALGTSMAAIVATAIASTRAHHRKAGVLWPVVLKMSPGILIGTAIATSVVALLNSVALALIFAIFMCCVALQMIFGIAPRPHKSLPSTPSLIVAGAFIGAISALVSIGGGTLSVPYLHWHSIELKRAIGTSAGIGLPIAIFGTLGFVIHGWGQVDSDPYILGFIYAPAVLLISLMSTIFAPMGVKFAYHLPVATVKNIFALLLLALSAKMLLSVV